MAECINKHCGYYSEKRKNKCKKIKYALSVKLCECQCEHADQCTKDCDLEIPNHKVPHEYCFFYRKALCLLTDKKVQCVECEE